MQFTHHNLFHSPVSSERKNFDLLLIRVAMFPQAQAILSDDVTRNQVFVISQYNLMNREGIFSVKYTLSLLYQTARLKALEILFLDCKDGETGNYSRLLN